TDRILSIIDETEFWEDKHTKSLKDTLETFDFTTFADKRFSEHLAKRNRVIIPDEEGEYIEFIIENTRKFHGADGLFIEVYTSASYIELSKSKVIEPQTTPSWTAKQHAEMALSGTEWAVGTVDFAGSRTITIESYTNPYSYLKQIASEFNLELHFRV
ncbi:phage tail spike protein, partial [Saccharococcus caldoxylosilyticus]|uniref:phage tail spike protein n=1 Tax=Saccharococcus caldoxylosilyticus TaxID=81408 RepID=UPI001911E0A1